MNSRGYRGGCYTSDIRFPLVSAEHPGQTGLPRKPSSSSHLVADTDLLETPMLGNLHATRSAGSLR